MKQKILNWKRQRIIFLVLGIIVIIISMYFFIKSIDGMLLFINFGLSLGAMLDIFICSFDLMRGYPTLQRKDLSNYQKVKVLSLFKKEEIGGITFYIYEIEIFKKKTTFLLEDTVFLKIDTSYMLTIDKEWVQK